MIFEKQKCIEKLRFTVKLQTHLPLEKSKINN